MVNSLTPPLEIQEPDDYRIFLNRLELTFQENGYYYQVSSPKESQGWLLDISCLPNDTNRLLKILYSQLKDIPVSFKLVKSRTIHYVLNNGIYGIHNVGKDIVIFLEDIHLNLPNFISALNELTRDFKGPTVFTDFRVGEILYVRYGSYTSEVLIDQVGNRGSFIIDNDGEKVSDQLSIPPYLPNWIENPFNQLIAKYNVAQKYPWVGKGYVPFKKIRSNIKGDVIKCAYLNQFFLPAICILKQGRLGMYTDTFGRDMKNLLLWQADVARQLADLIPIPKVLDTFIQMNTQCLVMEYIPGPSLLKKSYELLETEPWFLKEQSVRDRIERYLIQVAKYLEIIHRNGIIHRDVTAENFIVYKERIFLIDLELVFNAKTGLPDPPFQKGTLGYMSPNQNNEGYPRFQDDIYAFGALMIHLLSGGVEPSHVVEQDVEHTKQKIHFITHDEELASLILRCISIEERERPDSTELPNLLEARSTRRKNAEVGQSNWQPVTSDIKRAVQCGINYLCEPDMTEDGLWYSYLKGIQDTSKYPLGDKHVFKDIYRGVAGPLYLLAIAHQCDFLVERKGHNLICAWTFIQECLHDAPLRIGGLHIGNTGIGVTISTWLKTGMMKETPKALGHLRTCFELGESIPTDAWSWNIMGGMSGDGLALLQCENYLSQEFSEPLLSSIADRLTAGQLKDGSWQLQGGFKVTGFGYGVAGNAYFLLEYGKRKNNTKAIHSALAALDYLRKVAIKNKTYWAWRNEEKGKERGHWWAQGGPGIALGFLKSYEYFGHKQDLDIAERALRFHPKQVSFYNLTQFQGISGLGEIYLEAYRICGNEEWKDRADWIAAYLCAMRIQPSSDSVYWLTEEHNVATADFMVGSSGVLHFLIRYLYQDKVGFPLLPHPLHSRLP